MNRKLILTKIITFILAVAILIMITPIGVVNALDITKPYEGKYYVTTSRVIYNFNTLYFPHDKLVMNGFMLVSVKDFFDYFGNFSYSWNETNKSLKITDGTNNYTIYVGTYYMLKDGVRLDSPVESIMYKDQPYATLKVLADALRLLVMYDDLTDTIVVANDPYYINNYFTQDDLYWLSRLVEAESGYESYEGMVAVANVVLNRVRYNEFPNTVYGVIFDKQGGTQFTPVASGSIYNDPSPLAVEAARDALNGYNNIGNALFFFNPKIAKSFWIAKACTYYGTIGNHDFYY